MLDTSFKIDFDTQKGLYFAKCEAFPDLCIEDKDPLYALGRLIDLMKTPKL